MDCRRISYFTLLLSMLGCFVTVAQADDYDVGSMHVRGASGCLNASVAAYSCVSLTPPSYSFSHFPRLHNADIYSGTALNGETEADDFHLLPLSFTYQDKFKFGWQVLRQVQGMNLNFKLDRSGAGMNVDMGGLELNVFVKDGENQLLETGVFLGVDTRW